MPTTYQPTVNVPFHMTLKYIDVWPNDTTKNNGRGYGASLSLRGLVNGDDVRVYPKGFLDANLAGMVNAGIIAAPETGDFDYDPVAKYSLPVRHGEIVVTLSQPAGQKHPKTLFAANGQTPPQIKSAPVASAPTTNPYADEAPHPAESYSQTRTPEPAPQNTSKLTQVERQYETTLTWVLDSVIPKLSKADIPVDASAVNAIVATCLIQASKS